MVTVALNQEPLENGGTAIYRNTSPPVDLYLISEKSI